MDADIEETQEKGKSDQQKAGNPVGGQQSSDLNRQKQGSGHVADQVMQVSDGRVSGLASSRGATARCVAFNIMLLLLNSVTPFFHNLSNKSHATEEISYDATGWQAKVDHLKKSGGSHSGSVPSLTGHSQHTASHKSSVLSKQSALAVNIAIKIADGCDKEGMGLSDQDE